MIENNKQKWDLVIKPKKHIFDIHLKDLWRYRDLIVLFVRRDFIASYKQTILGPLWFIIQPVLTTLMFTVVFGRIAKIPTDGIPPFLFYLTGLTAWNYFAACLNSTSNTFVANAGIFGKVYFPRLAVPVSIVISGLFRFAIQFLLLIILIFYFLIKGYPINISLYALLIPILLIIIASMGLGFGIIFSSMTTKYRDLTNLLGFGVQLWMYATPIIYPLSEIPQKYKVFIIANPMTPIVETFRFALLGKGSFDLLYLSYSLIFTILLLAIGIVVFNKVEQSFMDYV